MLLTVRDEREFYDHINRRGEWELDSLNSEEGRHTENHPDDS